MAQPIRIHPENPKLFEFRGKPLMLLTATEHYGAVMNRPFDYRKYLADAAEKGMTLTRLFLLFRELQSALNPYSTCKPESTDYISPFPRTGPGKAADGLPRYDLDQWNPEFYRRLHGFVSLASQYGIIVEVVLLSNTYGPEVWALNPLHAANNLSGLADIPWWEYNTLRDARRVECQLAHVRKAVAELNSYDNVIFELCNEPGGGLGGPAHPTPSETNEWLKAIAAVIREVEADLPNKHLIVGQEAFTYTPWEQPSTLSFADFPLDVVNIHPLPNTTYQGGAWDMGTFMSGELKLAAVRDYCLATWEAGKPLNLDEDNVASRFMDPVGWTIHRKRAWTSLLSGAHYDYIDFSIHPWREAGTPDSQRHVRSWFGHLARFIHSLPLARCRPLTEVVVDCPEPLLPVVFGAPDEDIALYLADEREQEEPGCGEAIRAGVELALAAGKWRVACFSPTTGGYSPELEVASDGHLRLDIPEFRHDLAVRFKRS